MSFRFITEAFSSGRGVGNIITLLSNYDYPLSERDAALLKRHNESTNEGESVEDEKIEALMKRPHVYIPRKVVFFAILSALKIPYLGPKWKKELVLRLLPQVFESFESRHAARLAAGGDDTLDLIDVKLASSKIGVVSAEDWLVVLNSVNSQLPIQGRKYFKSIEVILGVLVQECDSNPELAAAVKDALLTSLVKLISAVFSDRMSVRKRDTRPIEMQQRCAKGGDSCFFTSQFSNRLKRRLEGSAAVAQLLDNVSPRDASRAIIAEALKKVISPDYCIKWNLVTNALKQAPDTLYEILGDAPIPGVLVVDKPEEVINFCLFRLSQRDVTKKTVDTVLSVLQALPSKDLHQNYCSKVKAFFTQFYGVIISNAAIFQIKSVIDSFVRIFVPANKADSKLSEEEWEELCTVTRDVLQQKCRSGEERIAVLTGFAALAETTKILGFSLCSKKGMFELVKPYIDSGVEELMGLCWRCLSAADACGLVEGHAVMRNMEKPTHSLSRHMCCANASESFHLANKIWEDMQRDAIVKEVLRPDAFLSLLYVQPGDIDTSESFRTHVLLPEVTQQLRKEEHVRAAQVAISVNRTHHFVGPLGVALCDSDGVARKLAANYVKRVLKDDVKTLLRLWDFIVKNIFTEKDVFTGSELMESNPRKNAAHAVEVVASLLLDHDDEIPVLDILTQILYCCGHDYTMGYDPLYYSLIGSAPGVYRVTFDVNTSTFSTVFKNHMNLLDLHSEELASRLSKMLTGTRIAAVASGRILGVLLTRFTMRRSEDEAARARAAAQVTSCAILEQLKTSAEYFESQSTFDKVVTSSDPEVTEAYLVDRTHEMGLIVEYPKKGKLPRGMTEEDFESQKIRDQKALHEARNKLLKEIAERRQRLNADIERNLSPLLALRTVGFVAPCAVEGLSVIYSFIHSTLVREETPKVTRDYMLDACVGLLHHTALRHISKHFVCLSTELTRSVTVAGMPLSPADVTKIRSIATHIRQSFTATVPPVVFCVLQPFYKVVFKLNKTRNAQVIPTQTQHQLISVISLITSNSDIPMKSEAASLYLNVVAAYPGLLKTILVCLNGLAPHISASAFTPILRGCFLGNELQKECSITAISKLSIMNEYRRAAVVAFVMSFDASLSVCDTAKRVLLAQDFVLAREDIEELLELLKEFGFANSPSCVRIAKALVDYVQKFPDTLSTVVLPRIQQVGGIPAVRTIQLLTPLMDTAQIRVAFNYLCDMLRTEGVTPSAFDVIMNVGKILLSRLGVKEMEDMCVEIQTRLQETPPKFLSGELKELYGTICVIWLTIVAVRLNNVEFLEKTLEQQVKVLQVSTNPTVHGFIQECVYEIAHHERMRDCETLLVLGRHCLMQTLSVVQYGRKRAFAAGFAGITQGLGLRSLKTFNVLSILQQAQKEKQAYVCGAMIIIETLADSFGKAFDPYALSLVPQLLTAVAERDNKISDCADDASKAVMRNMSDVAMRQLIPKLAVGLQSSHTKQRTPSLSFIGFVAFCSPHMLAHTLPRIMTHITSCLFDANTSVSSAAMTALRRVAAVVSNQEIKDHVDIILKAMIDPSQETESALDALLYTRFTTSIDPASLVLMIPILSRGLVERSPTIKGKAAQIVASMMNLVNDPANLAPYCDELLTRLQNNAQEPQVDVRVTSAKAIASLAVTMRDTVMDRTYQWCFDVLKTAQTNAEMAGAAQVFVEEVLLCGSDLLFGSIEEIDKGIHDPAPSVREAFIHILVYAPATLPAVVFQEFLPIAFPWLLQALSDGNERVRNTALVAGSNILGLYGTKYLNLVLQPLLDGVISEETNQRQSSLLLLSKLIIYLVSNINKKIRSEAAASAALAKEAADAAAALEVPVAAAEDEETETNELMQAGVVQLETARDAERRGVSVMSQLEAQLGPEKLARALSALHVGRNEDSAAVRTEVTNAWQITVPDARRTVTKLLPTVISLLVKFASSEREEVVNVALKSIDYTCARTNALEAMVEQLAEQYKIGTRRHIVGALVFLTEILAFADKDRAVAMGGHIVACVLPSLQSKDEEIRTCAGALFERLSNLAGDNLLKSVLESQIDTSVLGVVEVVRVQPVTALNVVFNVLQIRPESQPYTSHHMDLIRAIFDVIENDNFTQKYIRAASDIIMRALAQGCEGSNKVMESLASYMPVEYGGIPWEFIQAAAAKKQTRLWRASVLAAGAYAAGITLENPQIIRDVYSLLIDALSGPEEVSTAAAQQIVALSPELDRRVPEATLSVQDREDPNVVRRALCNYSLNFLETIQDHLRLTFVHDVSGGEDMSILAYPRLFETFQSYYLRVLEFALPAHRCLAVEGLTELLSHLPKSVAPSVVGTLAGKCTKTLFTKQDGSVVTAIVRLCVVLLDLPAGGKERMVESTMMISMISALLCDSEVARALVHRVTSSVLRRSPVHAPMILGSIVTKRTQLESPILQAAVGRFISVVMRTAQLQKATPHCNTLLNLVMQWWEDPLSSSVAAAAGSAIGALVMNAAVTDSTFTEICARTLEIAESRGIQTVGGFACIYSLLLNVPERLPSDFKVNAAQILRNALSACKTDRLSKVWLLRCAALLTEDSAASEIFSPQSVLPFAQTAVKDGDECLIDSAFLLEEKVPGVVEELYAIVFPPDYSLGTLSYFDADYDDELASPGFA